jgi:hypothetical protein
MLGGVGIVATPAAVPARFTTCVQGLSSPRQAGRLAGRNHGDVPVVLPLAIKLVWQSDRCGDATEC